RPAARKPDPIRDLPRIDRHHQRLCRQRLPNQTRHEQPPLRKERTKTTRLPGSVRPRSGKTGSGNPYLKRALGEAAAAAARTDTFLGERYRLVPPPGQTTPLGASQRPRPSTA